MELRGTETLSPSHTKAFRDAVAHFVDAPLAMVQVTETVKTSYMVTNVTNGNIAGRTGKQQQQKQWKHLRRLLLQGVQGVQGVQQLRGDSPVVPGTMHPALIVALSVRASSWKVRVPA